MKYCSFFSIATTIVKAKQKGLSSLNKYDVYVYTYVIIFDFRCFPNLLKVPFLSFM